MRAGPRGGVSGRPALAGGLPLARPGPARTRGVEM
jgi:hypothetical protein